MRLSTDSFRNSHGRGEMRLSTPEMTQEQVEFAKGIEGNFAVEQPSKRFPAIWRFSREQDGMAFLLRFDEARSLPTV